MMQQPINPEQFQLLFIPTFIGMWIFIGLFLSFLGGWRELGQVYHADKKIEGHKWSWQSGYTRFGVNYNHCLNIRANRNGIYIAISLPFRLGHPPLFIPWSDITIKRQKVLFFKQICFTFAKVPSVSFRISERLADKISLAVGEAWPI
jgi:hypothetical protein